MATIKVSTTEAEQCAVFKAVEELQQGCDISMPMTAIAKKSGLSLSRARYAMADLVEANKVRKIPTRAINEKYIRYKYETV